MSGGGSGSSTTNTVATPWTGVQEGLKKAAADAQALYTSGGYQQSYFPNSTVVNYSPETQAAMALTANRAITGSPVTNSAQGLLTNTLEGDYLNNNPHLDATVNRALDDVQSRVSSTFAGGGRFGGGLNQEVLAKSLGDTAGQIRGANYEAERNRQMQGMLFAPQMANQDYVDMQQLGSVGAAKESLDQAKLQEQIDRFYFAQGAPENAIGSYAEILNRIGGNYGAQTTTGPKAGSGSGIARGLGGALGGFQLGSQIGGPGGGMIGAGLGLLGGLF